MAIAPFPHSLSLPWVSSEVPCRGQGAPIGGWLSGPSAEANGPWSDRGVRRPSIQNRPPHGRSQPLDVLAAQVQEVGVPFGDQVHDLDLPVTVGQGDCDRRFLLASHLGTGSHGEQPRSHRCGFQAAGRDALDVGGSGAVPVSGVGGPVPDHDHLLVHLDHLVQLFDLPVVHADAPVRRVAADR